MHDARSTQTDPFIHGKLQWTHSDAVITCMSCPSTHPSIGLSVCTRQAPERDTQRHRHTHTHTSIPSSVVELSLVRVSQSGKAGRLWQPPSLHPYSIKLPSHMSVNQTPIQTNTHGHVTPNTCTQCTNHLLVWSRPHDVIKALHHATHINVLTNWMGTCLSYGRDERK